MGIRRNAWTGKKRLAGASEHALAVITFPGLATLQRPGSRMSAAGRVPLFHFSQLSLSHPPAAFLAPLELTPSPTPFDLATPSVPFPSAATQPDRPLFLGIDSGVDRIKACVLDGQLRVVWTAKVEIDQELSEYG